MTEGDGILFPLAWIVVLLLEGLEPCRVVDFVEWEASAREKPLYLMHQFLARVTEVQGMVAT